jgi:hypothetical protein
VASLLVVGLAGFLGLMLTEHGNAGASRPATGPPPAVSATALNSYVNAIEAVRLPVNQLLEQADPILDGYREHRITPAVAAQQMGTLEQRFAGYLMQMNPSSMQSRMAWAPGHPGAGQRRPGPRQ